MNASPGPSDPTTTFVSEEETRVEGAVHVARVARVADAPLERGAALGPYVILEVVGRGGMGIVYAAYDPRLDRRVAIKLLHPRLATSRIGARARLTREAQAMARLTHPNVVAIHDVGTFGDRVFLAMDFVDGVTLKAWLRKPRSCREVLDALLAAGRGLVAAHEAGIIHRDFKPDNVLVGNDGRVVVTDFGLARSTGRDRDSSAPSLQPDPPSTPSFEPPPESGPSMDSAVTLTEAGTTMGTVGYMSPEQASSGAVDARADQFSFCATLYHALYEERPYESDSIDGYLAALEGGVREAPKDAVVPVWIRRILLKGLSRKPDDRYPTMRALLDDLSRDPRARRRRTLAMIATPLFAVVAITAWARVQGP